MVRGIIRIGDLGRKNVMMSPLPRPGVMTCGTFYVISWRASVIACLNEMSPPPSCQKVSGVRSLVHT